MWDFSMSLASLNCVFLSICLYKAVLAVFALAAILSWAGSGLVPTQSGFGSVKMVKDCKVADVCSFADPDVTYIFGTSESCTTIKNEDLKKLGAKDDCTESELKLNCACSPLLGIASFQTTNTSHLVWYMLVWISVTDEAKQQAQDQMGMDLLAAVPFTQATAAMVSIIFFAYAAVFIVLRIYPGHAFVLDKLKWSEEKVPHIWKIFDLTTVVAGTLICKCCVPLMLCRFGDSWQFENRRNIVNCGYFCSSKLLYLLRWHCSNSRYLWCRTETCSSCCRSDFARFVLCFAYVLLSAMPTCQ